jgi:HSP20 family protein
MKLIPWRKSSTELTSFRSELEDLFERFFDEPFGANLPEVFTKAEMPRMDVAEDEKELTVKVEVPGVEEKDLNVQVQEGFLTISGEKRHEAKEEKKNFHRRELSYGAFQRSFALPPSVAGDKAQADFSKGVLTIRLPKTASNGKRIEIKKG